MKALASLDTCASYGTLTGSTIEHIKSGERFQVLDLIDTNTGLVMNCRPLGDDKGSPVWVICWMYRRSYRVVA